MCFRYLFAEMYDFLSRFDLQFGVTDYIFPVNSVHSISGSDMRIHDSAVDGVFLLLRRHFIPGRTVSGFDSLALLHYFPRHRVYGGEVFEFDLLHPLST